MPKPNPYKTVSSKVVYQNPWLRIREDKIIRPEGTDGIYGVLESKDSVMIVVLNKDDQVFLIYTYNYPSQSWNWELPGGGGEGENPVAASKRELLEETGIAAKSWDFLGKTRVCNGFMTEKMATYLARDIALTNKKSQEDEGLVDDGKFFSVSEIHQMIQDGAINDGQSITGLYLLERWLSLQR